jgi:hypothetical protein
MIWKIAELLAGGVVGWFERKQKLAQTKAENEAALEQARTQAEIARLGKSQDAEIAWDQEAVSQMKLSWKDEYFVVVWTTPLWLAMLPFEWALTASTAFFQTMDTAPDWYVTGMSVMIAASFGVRKIIDIMRSRK